MAESTLPLTIWNVWTDRRTMPAERRRAGEPAPGYGSACGPYGRSGAVMRLVVGGLILPLDLRRSAMIGAAESPAIQARPQSGCPVLVKAPAIRIMRIGIGATARSTRFATFHFMTCSRASLARPKECNRASGAQRPSVRGGCGAWSIKNRDGKVVSIRARHERFA